jgi:hypothetical protein
MYEHLEMKNVIARKQHKCDWCEKPINKGEEYERQKFKYDGEFCEWHAHLACSRVVSAIWNYADPDEGMSSDEFDSTCADVCSEFICPDCENWNKEYSECEKDESYCIERMDEFFKSHELYRAKKRGFYDVWKCRERRTDENN